MEYDQRLYDDRCTITATDPLNNTATRAFLSLMVGWKHWAYRRKED